MSRRWSVSVFLRNGTKYAAAIGQASQYCDPADVERTARPIREVIARGVREQVLRDDLREDIVFAMFSAIVERALWLTIGESMTPEETAEAAVAIFLGRRPQARLGLGPEPAGGPGNPCGDSAGSVTGEGRSPSVSRVK